MTEQKDKSSLCPGKQASIISALTHLPRLLYKRVINVLLVIVTDILGFLSLPNLTLTYPTYYTALWGMYCYPHLLIFLGKESES